MRALIIFALLLSGHITSGQITYTGTVGTYTIELVTNLYSDGVGTGTYVYTKHNTPIKLRAKLKGGTLTLSEKTGATLRLKNYSDSVATLTGIWKDAVTKKELPVTLKKVYEYKYGSTDEWAEKELMQDTSFADTYFKLVLTKQKDKDEPDVTGLRLYNKKTQKLVQHIATGSNRLGISNITIGDFNFDGYADFSLFETSYAGPNTSDIFFLYDPIKKTYFNAGYDGVSLEFNYDSKEIFERNQCCAGAIITTAIYKVVKNKMVLKERHCYKWDEKKLDHVERPYKECE